MDAVTAVIGRIEQVVIAGVANDLVEIDNRIKSCFGSEPVVHLIADFGFSLAPAIAVRMTWNDRDTDDFDSFGLNATHDVPDSRFDLLGANLPANVVGSHKQDDMADTGVRQHIAVKTSRPGGLAAAGTRCAPVTVLPPIPSLMMARETGLINASL